MPRHFVTLTLLAATALSLGGCYGVLLSGATAAGVAAAEERSVGTIVDDKTIYAEIQHFFLQTDVRSLLIHVEVRVNEGRVLLVGRVARDETAVEAVRLAWLAHGVKEVINEIKITEPQDAIDYAKDAWISTQIKTRLLATKDVLSINYTVQVLDGTVFLLGVAQHERELRDVSYIASRIEGVKKVISYVRLKDDPERHKDVKKENAAGS